MRGVKITTMQIFINGDFVSDTKPLIHINDRGFLLGDGIFETIKSVDNHLLYFEQHFNRLQNSAKALAIPCQYEVGELSGICESLLVANELQNDVAVIRITLTRGRSPRGIGIPSESHPTLLITASLYQGAINSYPTALITDIRRNEYASLVSHKTIDYLESILARKAATEKGFDEGIMLNTQGAITASSVANLFFVVGDTVLTPRIQDGILPGIIRQSVIESCRRAQIPVIEAQIMPAEALQATEAFQTNSLIGVQSLSTINSQRLKIGQYAKFTQKIAALCP